MDELPLDKAKNGRPSAYSDKVADEIVAACRSGFTMEKAAELVGLEPKTVQNWVGKRREFGERIKKARREHELSLLRDIEQAGAKSWQAKAWMAERVYNYAQPSARLQVAGEVQHGISGNLVAMLAGIASRRVGEKAKAQVIDINSDIKQIKNNSINHSKSINCKDKTSKNNYNLLTNQQGSYNNCCATNEENNNSQIVNNQQNYSKPKARHIRMKRRKPRARAMDTTTPPASPPAPV
jgi:hypothetical protein